MLVSNTHHFGYILTKKIELKYYILLIYSILYFIVQILSSRQTKVKACVENIFS